MKQINESMAEVEHDHHERISMEKPIATGSTKEVSTLSVALANACALESPSAWTLNMFKLYAIILVACMNACMNGFDGSIMGGINAMPQYHLYFGVPIDGPTTGLIFALFTVGNMTGAWAAGPAADFWGRRWGMVIGSVIVLAGVAIQGSAQNVNQFMGSRVVLGFGVAIAGSAGPTYVIEMAHPVWRGTVAGLYNGLFYYVGAIAATWVMYGTNNVDNQMSWRLPIAIQAFPSIVVLVFALFLPESPRWLIAHDRDDEAMAILVTYHGDGNPESSIANLEFQQIRENVREHMALKKPWWDYREFANTREARYRLWCVVILAFFGSYLGGSVIAYYSPIMLKNAGITSSSTQLLINAINTITSMLAAVLGSFIVDKVGRRKLIISSTIACWVCYLLITVCSALYGVPGENPAGSRATIAFIVIYGVCFSIGWTPMQQLYPLECWTYETRARGMGLTGFLGGAASFVNTYAAPVALRDIGWKFYLVFLIWNFVQVFLMWKFFPETKGRTLEELTEIFRSSNPVKASLTRTKVVVSEGAGVQEVLSGEDKH